MAKRGSGVGGYREGSGRKARLHNPQKVLIRFEPRHLRIIAQYAKANDLDGRSPALRHMLDNYDFTT